MNLRPYQQKAHDCVLEEWKSVKSTLVVCPTGGGKTRIASAIIQSRQPGRSLFLCHRQELVWQAANHIKKVTGLNVGIEMGENRIISGFLGLPDVVVATIQTLTSGGDGSGRLSKFLPEDFDTIILDEAHHSVSSTWKKVVRYFSRNIKLRVLGITATPDRSTEESLGQVFDTAASDYEILDAIKDGWLIPIEQQMVEIESLDFSQIHTQAGDLNGAELSAVMEQEKNLHGIASASIQIVGNRRGIGFASSVNHARILADIFNRHRLGMAHWISAKTDKGERKKILSDFAAGKIQFVWNCAVLTEGFDDSGVEVILMARPTKSRSLYSQMIGRSTRPHETIAHKLNQCPVSALRRSMIERSVKPSCLIVDFVGNAGKHKLISSADVLGGNCSDEAVAEAVKFARKSGKPVRMDVAVEEQEKRLEEKRRRELEIQARKARLVGTSTFKAININPFDLLHIHAAKPRGWDNNKIASEKMRGILRKMGLNPDDYTYTQTRQLVAEQINRWNNHLCSIKQAKWLVARGYDANIKFDHAKKIMDAWQKNGWKKPHYEIEL